MVRLLSRGSAILALAVTLVLLSTIPALAHERRDVGAYRLVVGWINEPALVEEPNGVDFRVTRISDDSPVEGLEKTVKVSLAYAGGKESEPQPLRARFGMPGRYTLDVFPTKAGEYTFRFTGEIEGQKIDEVFTSGPGRFNHVEEKRIMMFPQQEPSISELSSRVQMLGLAGVVLGALGLVAGGVALTVALTTRRSIEQPAVVPSLQQRS